MIARDGGTGSGLGTDSQKTALNNRLCASNDPANEPCLCQWKREYAPHMMSA
ncbi:hypothetical protein [Devosia sp. LjRoot3]|uniref:hypothetical protein n=1 Tax=Devosia sp. LjRoot3 TaxID=3342319 RepID=UPI003ED004C2